MHQKYFITLHVLLVQDNFFTSIVHYLQLVLEDFHFKKCVLALQHSRQFSLSRNKKKTRKPSSGKGHEIVML